MCSDSRVSTTTDSLPNDIESLRALALKAIAERDVAIAERTAAIKERDAERAEKAKLVADRADFDEVARAIRDYVARCSDMMSPVARCLAGG